MKLLPASIPLGGALGVLMALVIGTVPACSSGAESPQDGGDVKPMETAKDDMQPAPIPVPDPAPDPAPAGLPPIDAAAPKVTQTATFASGWFWGPDSQFGSIPGVIRTRVGYSGGVKANPTYYSLGNHTETYEIDFDPTMISYSDLLAVFWQTHNPHAAVFSQQYKAAVFYHDAEQQRLAEAGAAQLAAASGRSVTTEIRPAEKFWRAEDYHQKYGLRNTEPLIAELARYYDVDSDAFTDSTLAARLNAYASLKGHESILLSEMPSYGVTAAAEEILREVGPLLRDEAVAICGLVDNGI